MVWQDLSGLNGLEGYRNEMKSIHSYRNGVSFLAHSKVICIRDHTGNGLTKVLESVKSAKFFPEGINLYERKGHLKTTFWELMEDLRKDRGPS